MKTFDAGPRVARTLPAQLQPNQRAVDRPDRDAVFFPRGRRERKLPCFVFFDVDAQPWRFIDVREAVGQFWSAGQQLVNRIRPSIVFLNTERGRSKIDRTSRAKFTGSLSPPSCHAVRTPNVSHRFAIFLAGVMPPTVEMRQRT